MDGRTTMSGMGAKLGWLLIWLGLMGKWVKENGITSNIGMKLGVKLAVVIRVHGIRALVTE